MPRFSRSNANQLHPARALLIWMTAGGLVPSGLTGQASPPPPGSEPVVVVPAARYDAGSTFRALAGSGYRDLWRTAIEVPVADLSEIGGGLEVRKLGGGVTTRTLHFDGADGQRYVFRSVDKRLVYFEEYAGSPVGDLLQDQVSSFHPSGAPIVAHLLDAVGVLHASPTLMVVPDDPRLGAFAPEFAGTLVLVEERPDDGPAGGFGGSERVVQTRRLFRELEADARHRVDAEDYLRSRLVDLLVGDRDRSHNNNLWASYPQPDGSTVWRVIPRDRDQAFIGFDGALKTLARRYDRRLITFDDTYPDIAALSRNAWDMDRSILVSLEREAWDRAVEHVQAGLTDDVIREAVAQMPREHADIVGDDLVRALTARRDGLGGAADALYAIVNEYAAIYATDEPETLLVDRGPEAVTVTVSAGEQLPPTFHRVFHQGESREVRIYLRGGDDRVYLSGAGADPIRVRVIGGGGDDAFHDETTRPQPQTVLYDGGEGTRFPESGAATVRRESKKRPYSWFEGSRSLDWGSRTVTLPTVSYDQDRGLLMTARVRHDRFGFGKAPFAGQLRLTVGYSFGSQKPLLEVDHLTRHLAGPVDLRVRARWSGIESFNYYGLGNGTTAAGPSSYYGLSHDEASVNVMARLSDEEHRYVEVGPTFIRSQTDTTSGGTFIGETRPYGSGAFSRAGVALAFGVDTRDRPGVPAAGYTIEGEVTQFLAVLDAEQGSFGGMQAEVAAYFSPQGGNPVLALRAAGARRWGPTPFSHAATVGGSRSVRSLPADRFAGDAMALGSAEARVEVARSWFPVPSRVGLLFLADAGRVFADGDDASLWHTAVGGGVWMALADRSHVVQLTWATGQEGHAWAAGLGFAF